MDLPVFLLKAAIFAGAFFVLIVVLITLLFLIGFVTPALAWFHILFG
jgi:hypothetical protein